MDTLERKLKLSEKKKLLVMVVTKSGDHNVGKVKVGNSLDSEGNYNVMVFKYKSADSCSINIKNIEDVYGVKVSNLT